MNRGEMIDDVREMIGDENTTTYTRVRLENSLNRAAKWVVRYLDRFKLDEWASSSEEVAITTTKPYSVAMVATDVLRVRSLKILKESGGDEIGRVMATNQGREYDPQFVCYRYFMTRATGTGNLPTIVLTGPPASATTYYNVYYTVIPADIATGSGANDLLSYTEIPELYHDLVVSRAAFRLAGPDNNNMSNIAAEYIEQKNSAVMDSQYSTEPRTIRDEW